MRKFLILLIVFLLANPIWAASYLMLTDLGSSAEMIGKGNIEGFSKSSNCIFENPAGLYRIERYSASFFTSTIMEEVNYNNTSIAFNSGNGVFAIGYMSSGVDDIAITGKNEAGLFYETGDAFAYKNSIAKLGYQYSLSQEFHLGASLSMYTNKIHTVTGTGMGIDTGLLYNFSNLDVSLHARNILPQTVKYEDSADSDYSGEEDLPLQVVLGLLYPLGDFDFMGQIKFDGINSLVSLGGAYSPSFMNLITLSCGYKEFSVLDNVQNNFTIGVSLNLLGLHLDAAYEKSDHIEFDSHTYFSASINL